MFKVTDIGENTKGFGNAGVPRKAGDWGTGGG